MNISSFCPFNCCAALESKFFSSIVALKNANASVLFILCLTKLKNTFLRRDKDLIRSFFQFPVSCYCHEESLNKTRTIFSSQLSLP